MVAGHVGGLGASQQCKTLSQMAGRVDGQSRGVYGLVQGLVLVLGVALQQCISGRPAGVPGAQQLGWTGLAERRRTPPAPSDLHRIVDGAGWPRVVGAWSLGLEQSGCGRCNQPSCTGSRECPVGRVRDVGADGGDGHGTVQVSWQAGLVSMVDGHVPPVTLGHGPLPRCQTLLDIQDFSCQCE